MGLEKSDWVAEAVAELPPMCRIAEVSGVVRLGPRQIKRLIAVGRIHAVRNVESGSSPLLVPRSEVERYLRSLEVAA